MHPDLRVLAHMRASSPVSTLACLKKRVARESPNQTNQFPTNGGRALVTLILLLALAVKTRGSGSSSFTAVPLFATLITLSLFHRGSYPRHVRRSHHKREQCRGIAILCKHPRAVSALVCFPSLSPPVVVSTLHPLRWCPASHPRVSISA